MRCETFFAIIMSAFCYTNWRLEDLLKQIFIFSQNFESFLFLSVYLFSPRHIEHVKSSIFIFRLIVWNCFVKTVCRLSNYLTKFDNFFWSFGYFWSNLRIFSPMVFIQKSLVQIIIYNLGSSSCTEWTSIVQGQYSMLMNLIETDL